MSIRTREIFCVFQTDTWMTTSSRVQKGAFSSLEKAVDAIIKNGEFDEDWLDEQEDDALDYVKDYLLENRQTPQCGSINYIIEQVELDSWEE